MSTPIFKNTHNPEDVVVIYHANCPDGFGAAYCAWRTFGNKARYVPYQHGDLPVDVSGKHVVMVDCCYCKDDACAVHDKAESFITLDHHHTAQQECGNLDFCYFDMSRSGSGLAWDYFHPNIPRPELITHVEARDLWRWENPDTKPFCLKLDTLPRDFATWDAVASMNSYKLVEFLAEGRAMVAQSEAMIERFCQDARKVMFCGYRVWLLNVPRPFVTDDCGAMLASRDDTDFALLWNAPDLDEVRLSLRSANGFDVSNVAKMLGGGGHKAASGATLDIGTFRSLVTFM